MTGMTTVDGDDATPGARRVGRPRRSGAVPSGVDVRRDIVEAATRLFLEKGLVETSMRDIARAAGLQQSSLYYYFSRKELILEAAVAVNSAPLEFLEAMSPSAPAVRLYRFVRFDTRQLCLSPWDVNEIERLAHKHPAMFEGLWSTRRVLHSAVSSLLAEGVAQGEFLPGDVTLTALAVTSFNEGVQNWFRTSDIHRPGGPSPFQYPAYSVDEVAELVATAVLRMVLADPSRLDDIRARADETEMTERAP